MLIKNLKKASQRIKKAIKNKENIVLFSDSDFDGAASLLILEETIKTLAGKVSLKYFPDRKSNGYGLSKKALAEIKKFSPGLLILSDCGNSSFKELGQLKKFGFSIIIVDHHEITEKPPAGLLIVNPKQPTDGYPFKGLAACGVCFKLAREIFGEMPTALEKSFLELVALATIADKMPRTEENKEFIKKGLGFLSSTARPGLKVCLEFFPLSQYSLKEVGQKIASLFQISEMKGHLTESYLLLSSAEEKEAKRIFKKLTKELKERGEIIRELYSEIEERIPDHPLFVFEGGEGIPFVATGGLAGRLSSKTGRPAFVYTLKEGIVRGSVRSEQGISAIEALKSCSQYLDVFGGHAPAAGFTSKKENLEKLKHCLENFFKSQITPP